MEKNYNTYIKKYESNSKTTTSKQRYTMKTIFLDHIFYRQRAMTLDLDGYIFYGFCEKNQLSLDFIVIRS